MENSLKTLLFWRIPPINEEVNNSEDSSYLLEENGDRKILTIDGIYPNSIIKLGIIKENVNVDYCSDRSYRVSDGYFVKKPIILNIDEASQYLKSIFDYMKYRLQTSETYGKKFQGLPDEVILDYFKRITDSGTVEEALEKENMILVNDLENFDLDDFKDKNVLLRYLSHYSSLPIININGQRYLFDTLGDKHQDKNGKIIDEISTKFPRIKPLNPFGLDYQNDSNACGIWSANILKQVNKFKKNSKENEILKTYFYKDIGSYTVLNPEILFLAAVQVSKDLTPETKKPELKILNEGEEPEEGYVKVKIGNTIFSMDTAYRPESCIDIQTLALSIPEVELINNIDELISKIKKSINDAGIDKDSSEFQIVTEIFLYKFLNDKFKYVSFTNLKQNKLASLVP